MIDITALVRTAVRESGVDSGIVCVFCPHTTAAITLQDNSDSVVKSDIMEHLSTLVPRDAGCVRPDDNLDAHVKASLLGSSTLLIVDSGQLVLGPWQAVFFCEFDGPRTRCVHLVVTASE
jgi:secondary thiamine-phosphate synthase enzyme